MKTSNLELITMKQEHFGQLVKSIRKDLGMVQVDFCKAIGVAQGSLSKIEKDELTTNVDVLISLSRYVADKPKMKARVSKYLFGNA